MRHLLRFTFLILAITFSASVFGQNLLSKANKQYELKAYSYAIANYLKVIAKEPNEPQALARLGDSYRMLNKMDEAERWFAKAVQVAGIDPVHFFHYGKTLMAKGKYEDAKIWFETYAESDPLTGDHFVKSCDYALSLQGQPATFRVYKEYLNTRNSDFGPAFFGDYIVYSSSRTDLKRKMKKNRSKGFSDSPNNQLYITSMDKNGFLRTPTLLQSDLQNNYNEGPVAYSPSGEWVVFTRNIFENGVRQIPEAGGTLAMYIAEVDANGSWSNVKALPFNRNGFSAGYPAFSMDGKVLYFASTREGGFGGWDLYSSFRTATGWSSPENLGEVVNTPGDEIAPNLDGNKLYFSSDYHHGLGGMDIFKAVKKDDSWNEIYHMGNALNTPRDDYGFIFNAEDNRGYLVSNRNKGQGNEDLYKVKKMSDNFVISVVNESDMTPVEGALVDFSACGEPNYTTDINGKYVFEAMAGLDCDLVIKKDGFKPYSIQISSLGQRLSRNYQVKLRKISDEFVGKIVNSENNESVEGVVIKATSRSNGLVLKSMSNKWGEYKLALSAREKYTISYSKAGFINTQKIVTIASKTDKSQLGILSFKPTYSVGTTGGGVTMNTDDESVETIADDETVIPELDQVQTEDPIVEMDNLVQPKGFAVQVAAYFDGREVKVNKYSNLQEIGNVYKMKEGEAEKVRVGIYPTKKEAEVARKEISKKGYAKAFIVSEEGKQSVDLRVEEENEKGGAATETIESKGDDTAATVSSYKVRVATFRSTKNFDDEQLNELGEVERRKAGKFTIVLLGGYRSQKMADAMLEEVTKMGYKDAHLVEDDGKNIKRVK